jgi:Cu-processing system permease protein
VLADVLRNRWILGYALFFLVATDLLVRLGGTGPRALVSLLNLVLALVPLVTVVFGTIYWHGAREFTELLLTQPVQRSTLFHGLFAGLVVPLIVAFALGVTLPLLTHRVIGPETAGTLGMLLVVGALLTAIFGAIAVLIGGLVDDRLKGLGIALGVWVVCTLAFDGVLLWIAVSFRDYPIEGPLLALSFANPVDLARILMILRLDLATMMGVTGAIFTRSLGSTLGMLAALGVLVLWALIPGYLALRTFRRRDF